MQEASQFPVYRGRMEYVCQVCGARYPGLELHYSCPDCRGVFLLENVDADRLRAVPGWKWREVFDQRAASRHPGLQGIFRFYELMAPILEPRDIVTIGEGQTPVVEANKRLQDEVGVAFAMKNEGQNPSASFKDRGMACAFSYLCALVRKRGFDEVLTVCASTGDTSAAAAMYAAYVGGAIRSVVLLPQGKVTPEQLAQPLGSGAVVLELPGVFDDCMRVVEHLADHYRVALLNSKNSWRILGQESYAFELAQRFDWDMAGRAVFVPIGNAGNISAVLAGFLKLHSAGLITALPRIFGVQSSHADPVFRYYRQDRQDRAYAPVEVSPSVAQAAMIGNPVSFPRVRSLVERYEAVGGSGLFEVVQVSEQEIIESMLLANRHGHIACTQGGECLAGLRRALAESRLKREEYPILDATAHALKFQAFQEMYFTNAFPPEYGIVPRQELINRPQAVLSREKREEMDEEGFISAAAEAIVSKLGLSAEKL
jgi:threonine synthase